MTVPTPTTATPPATSPETPPVTPPATPPANPPATPPATPPAAPDTEAELPAEKLRELLTATRGEAANYRVKLREAETKLSLAKTPEEFAATVTELKATNAALERSLLVTKIAAEHELPAELAALLQGEDEATLKTHAKTLQKFVPTVDPASLGGGLTPGSNGEVETDPGALAKKYGRRR